MYASSRTSVGPQRSLPLNEAEGMSRFMIRRLWMMPQRSLPLNEAEGERFNRYTPIVTGLNEVCLLTKQRDEFDPNTVPPFPLPQRSLPLNEAEGTALAHHVPLGAVPQRSLPLNEAEGSRATLRRVVNVCLNEVCLLTKQRAPQYADHPTRQPPQRSLPLNEAEG